MTDLTDKLLDAIDAFADEVGTIERTKTADIHTKKGSYSYSYPTLNSLVEAIGPLLKKHNLSYHQKGIHTSYGEYIETMIRLKGSTEREFSYLKMCHENDSQDQGAAITYLRRYGLGLALKLLTEEDTDGKCRANTSTTSPSKDQNEDQEYHHDENKPYPFGKHKGTIIKAMDSKYFEWASKNFDGLGKQIADAELVRRGITDVPF